MHSFNLGMGSVIGYPWARDFITLCSRVVKYLRFAYRALAVVMEIAMSMGIKTKPQSANSTRLTSTLLMLESLQKLKPALIALVTTRRAEVIQSKEVLDAIAGP